jgi:PAS domain S-box-containing protein
MGRMTKRQLEEARLTIAGLHAARGGVDGETLLESRFAELLADSLPGIADLFDPDGVLLWWNRNMERVTGYSDLELAGTSILELVAPEERSLVEQWMRQVLETGEVSVEGHLVARDGGRPPYLFSADFRGGETD